MHRTFHCIPLLRSLTRSRCVPHPISPMLICPAHSQIYPSPNSPTATSTPSLLLLPSLPFLPKVFLDYPSQPKTPYLQRRLYPSHHPSPWLPNHLPRTRPPPSQSVPPSPSSASFRSPPSLIHAASDLPRGAKTTRIHLIPSTVYRNWASQSSFACKKSIQSTHSRMKENINHQRDTETF